MPVQYSYTFTPPMGRTACTEPQCLYSRAIPLLPCEPYGLYRASVPVQYSYTSTPPMGCTVCAEPQCLCSTAIPLLPCEPYGLYRASVPVQYSYTSTPPMGCTVCAEPQCLCKDDFYLFLLDDSYILVNKGNFSNEEMVMTIRKDFLLEGNYVS